jgi:hypothetical protein
MSKMTIAMKETTIFMLITSEPFVCGSRPLSVFRVSGRALILEKPLVFIPGSFACRRHLPTMR